MNNLLRMIGRRLIALPLMILGVTILVFILTSLNPIDQATAVLSENASPEALDAYRHEHGLDQPVIVQFFIYLGNLIQGDLGTYGANSASVADKIATALPVTLQLTFCGVLLGIIIALILGIVSAYYFNRWPDKLIRFVSIACISMPAFWLAVLFILLFSSTLGWFPASGKFPSFFDDPVWWSLRMFMPTLSLALPIAGQMTRIIRSSMVEELEKDYTRTALGGGIPPKTVVMKNVLRNALITPVTVLGLRIGYAIGGAVVIEVIFNLPGMGMAILLGIQNNFTMLIQGCVLVVAIVFIVINLIIDMLYLVIDPRIRSI